MDEAKTLKKIGYNRLILALLFFFRTGLLVPTSCFGIYSYEPHFNVTVQYILILEFPIDFSKICGIILFVVIYFWSRIEVVITRLTRNQFVGFIPGTRVRIPPAPFFCM